MTGTSLILNIRRENRVIVLDEAETGNGHLQSSSKKRCHGNFCQQVLARAWTCCLCCGQRRNVLIENLYDRNFPYKKYYRQPDIGNVVAELYSNGPYDRNSKFQCFEKVHLNFLYYSVLENNALQRNTSFLFFSLLPRSFSRASRSCARLDKTAMLRRLIERWLRRRLGRRKLCPSPVSGTLLLNVLSQNIGGFFIFFHLIKVLTQLTPCTERN